MSNYYINMKISEENGIETISRKKLSAKLLNVQKRACLCVINEWQYWKHARNIFALFKVEIWRKYCRCQLKNVKGVC